MARRGRIWSSYSLPLILAIAASSWAARSLAESGEEMPGEVPDAASAAPEVYTVLHEDERVRVVSMRLPAGETDGFHRHPHEVVYFTSGGGVSVEVPGAEAMEVDLPDGGVLSHEPWNHTVTNRGETEVAGIIVELVEEPGKRPAVEAGTDAVSVAPDYYTVLHEDERARVLDMRLPAGAEDGVHSHPDEVVYFLRGGKVRITTDEGEMELEIPDGHVLSHPAWTHSVENVGEGEIHAIVWELE